MTPSPPPAEVEVTSILEQSRGEIAAHLNYLGNADPAKAYQIIEQVLAAKPGLTGVFRRFIEHRPQVLEAAKRSFSTDTLQYSRIIYGAEARKRAWERLQIFRNLATQTHYLEAAQNCRYVFGDSEQEPEALSPGAPKALDRQKSSLFP